MEARTGAEKEEGASPKVDVGCIVSETTAEAGAETDPHKSED